MTDTADFFRSRLDQMTDLCHPLAVLASRMPWQELVYRPSTFCSAQAAKANASAGVRMFSA